MRIEIPAKIILTIPKGDAQTQAKGCTTVGDCILAAEHAMNLPETFETPTGLAVGLRVHIDTKSRKVTK